MMRAMAGGGVAERRLLASSLRCPSSVGLVEAVSSSRGQRGQPTSCAAAVAGYIGNGRARHSCGARGRSSIACASSTTAAVSSSASYSTSLLLPRRTAAAAAIGTARGASTTGTAAAITASTWSKLRVLSNNDDDHDDSSQDCFRRSWRGSRRPRRQRLRHQPPLWLRCTNSSITTTTCGDRDGGSACAGNGLILLSTTSSSRTSNTGNYFSTLSSSPGYDVAGSSSNGGRPGKTDDDEGFIGRGGGGTIIGAASRNVHTCGRGGGFGRPRSVAHPFGGCAARSIGSVVGSIPGNGGRRRSGSNDSDGKASAGRGEEQAKDDDDAGMDDTYHPPVHHDALQSPAGPLWPREPVGDSSSYSSSSLRGNDDDHHVIGGDLSYIPQIPLHDSDGRSKKRVLVLCTGGTLTMAPDPTRGNALAPVKGALTSYLSQMKEVTDPTTSMPEVVAHEYTPLLDSSDMGPSDWALIARDIQTNYYHFDGFVVLTGTDTMAYAATALSFMLENLSKPVVFTGSQIPLCEPYNDARRNLIMALIFASRDGINEVTIFFHDRLLRACRATKVNTTRLLAFDSPNMEPLAKIGINIEENEHLAQPPARGALRVHKTMDTRLITLRLVPGFDDAMMRDMIDAARRTHLKGLVLQLYGTGNIPSVKDDFVRVLSDATSAGVCVVAATQCHTGSVMMGHYATGRALCEAGVVSANDMTLEATSCKLAYLLGRGDLSLDQVNSLMDVSLRGEVTPSEALPPPPLSTAFQRASRKGKKYY